MNYANRSLKAITSGNASNQAMTDSAGAAVSKAPNGTPVGVFVDLGAGVTSVDVTIKDSRGYTIFTKTGIVADTYYPMGDAALIGTSCYGPPNVTTANIAGGTAVTTWLDVRE